MIDGVPGPGAVELKGIFDKGSPRVKAYSFGLSRDFFTKVYVEGSTQVDPAVPGPGRYIVPPIVGREGQIVSIKGKNSREKSHGKTLNLS